jgi:hypothetical protein
MRLFIFLILTTACTKPLAIECTNPPQAEILLLPIKVIEPPNCESQDAYIKVLQYRLNFENCTSEDSIGY